MKPALEEYLGKRKAVKAVFVGTRRTDPHGTSLTHFDPTDADWPQFMRVHPVIDWHYAEVWAVSYIRYSVQLAWVILWKTPELFLKEQRIMVLQRTTY